MDAVDVLKSRVLAPLNIGDEKQVKINNRVFKRFLQGETLSFDKIKKAMDAGKLESEASRRMSYLRKLMEISEMGGSDIFSVDKAEEEIKSNELRLKEILNKIDLNSLF